MVYYVQTHLGIDVSAKKCLIFRATDFGEPGKDFTVTVCGRILPDGVVFVEKVDSRLAIPEDKGISPRIEIRAQKKTPDFSGGGT